MYFTSIQIRIYFERNTVFCRSFEIGSRGNSKVFVSKLNANRLQVTILTVLLYANVFHRFSNPSARLWNGHRVYHDDRNCVLLFTHGQNVIVRPTAHAKQNREGRFPSQIIRKSNRCNGTLKAESPRNSAGTRTCIKFRSAYDSIVSSSSTTTICTHINYTSFSNTLLWRRYATRPKTDRTKQITTTRGFVSEIRLSAPSCYPRSRTRLPRRAARVGLRHRVLAAVFVCRRNASRAVRGVTYCFRYRVAVTFETILLRRS